ncbi:MAG: MaoC family dehydratase N-terminal domain-containing protein [Sphingomonadaceae bacterium]|nr:MaoC family dehydratase N-terminal domain-containing protein [Sphingomonadaceae bacterium]
MAELAESETTESAPRAGEISDADIERATRQIGVPQFMRQPPFNEVASHDAMRHFAFGAVGDDNPLWHDRSYGAKTRWRGTIAHPLFVSTMGLSETPKPTPELKELFRGLFRGTGKYHSGTDWEFYRPVYEGDRFYMEYTTADVQVKQSAFAGGRSVLDTYQKLFVDRDGRPAGRSRDLFVNAARSGSKETGRFASIKRQTYTPDDIARIDAVYDAERRRGTEPRWWEDVEAGEPLVPVAKGPMTMVDLISRHVGTGVGSMYNTGPLAYSRRLRKQMPAFFDPDTYGVPQVAQRVHWDHDRAVELGLPTAYDYAAMRFTWLAHLVTNWQGDDAWLWKISFDARCFNFMGDTHICEGEVEETRIEEGRPVAILALRAANQRGDVTTRGRATIILPSREHGPALLPAPPETLARRGAAMMSEAAARRR